MSAPKGNDFKVKFKTPEDRQQLCDNWCDHLSKGLSKECFPDCDPQTFKKYLSLYPDDFDTDKIEEAERLGRTFWEKTGIDGLWNETTYNENGKPEASRSLNAAVWCFNMKNRYGWRDKQELTGDPEKPLEHNHTLDISKASQEQLMDIIKGLGK
jgi:uncharacterized protein (DUF2249 family)